ncbi:MAG: N-acetylglucosamine kinase, partial [Bacteroidota bacterium]
MILIADSGSTRTDWQILGADQRSEHLSTKGMNPYYQGAEEMRQTIFKELLPHIQEEIKEIYFYGAGCSLEKNQKRVAAVLMEGFPEAKIEVSHDLLAAARSLGGKDACLVGILGTGSNACFYDGKVIASTQLNLGYILGDEGSGAHLGKQLIQDFMHAEMPPLLREKFARQFKITRGEILEQVYQKPLANRYLASFSKFLFENQEVTYCKLLVFNSFDDFIRKYLLKLFEEKPIVAHFIG